MAIALLGWPGSIANYTGPKESKSRLKRVQVPFCPQKAIIWLVLSHETFLGGFGEY
jgi:hypothetical protein